MKALLVIDMQKISFTPATPRFDTRGVVDRINLLSEDFREKGENVIFIQHDGTKEGFCIPETEEWKILDSLKLTSTDLIIVKTANDSFYKTNLQNELSRLGVKELIITGCATDFCVDSTVKSALVRDFNVTIIADGHTTADRPNIKAKRVIEYYNWIWSEMTPTEGRIKVMSFDKYIKMKNNAS
jgi:nicotinamidase-related amidase